MFKNDRLAMFCSGRKAIKVNTFPRHLVINNLLQACANFLYDSIPQYKKRTDFNDDASYKKYVKTTVRRGMKVRCWRRTEVFGQLMSAGDTGTIRVTVDHFITGTYYVPVTWQTAGWVYTIIKYMSMYNLPAVCIF